MEEQARKKIILSGIQPTGIFTLGNYLGAVRNWVTLQDEYQCAYMIADQHALTIRLEPAVLRRQILGAFAMILACGVDPEKSLAFIQSHVPEHSQLSWVLGCYTQFGELGRMTQFKDKSAKNADNINSGLFTYPVLMAADILIYQADAVPVGQDQKQHLELARNVAARFNSCYGPTFTVPEPYIPKATARICSLQEPAQKMSKSDPNPNATIFILDSPDDISRKFKRAVTDSESLVAYGEGRDGVNNLMSIYCAATGRTMEQTEADFAGKGYGDFKAAVAEAVVEMLRPVRERYDDLMKNKDYLVQLYTDGAGKASRICQRTIRKVYKKVGLIPLEK